MSDKSKMDALRLSLTNAIDAWANSECMGDNWMAVGYVGDNLSEFMADAAFAVLASNANAQEYLREQGYIKD